ncbi:MAG TPA: chemotaxis protein CheW [Acidisoma sp.]|jgi:purine-binding chemotaxis protein CheW|nr:chemotaxis protein CheW [Acidisoma sp.]
MSQPAQSLTSASRDKGNQLLSVRIGDQEFAMSIMAIREIRGWITSTPLPHAPPYIKGMINLRGTVLAIVDLAARLGLPSRDPTPASVVVVVEMGDKAVGLLVDAVSDIITVTEDMRQVIPDTGDSVSRTYIENLIMTNQRIIGILSLSTVIPQEQISGLELQPA